MDLFFAPDLHMGDPALEYRFFAIYSVCEYALKAMGYTRSDRWDGVKPDWEGFVIDIEKEFDWHQKPELEEAVRYLFENPPRRQVLRGRHLDWELNQRPPDDTDALWLLRLVKTVRNNLFHGGKKPFDPDRDARLLKSCIQVLLAWAELKPEINKVVFTAYNAIPEKLGFA
jgi:hypothetical protein